MEYVLAIYRSRNVSMQVYNYLMRHGVTCALVSTPRRAGVGCGLSVKIARGEFAAVKDALASAESFAGFFLYRSTYSGGTLTRI